MRTTHSQLIGLFNVEFDDLQLRWPSGIRLWTSIYGRFEFNLYGQITSIWLFMQPPGDSWRLMEIEPDDSLYEDLRATLSADYAEDIEAQIADWHSEAHRARNEAAAMEADGASAAKIAAAMSRKYQPPVSTDDVKSGGVWWLIEEDCRIVAPQGVHWGLLAEEIG